MNLSECADEDRNKSAQNREIPYILEEMRTVPREKWDL